MAPAARREAEPAVEEEAVLENLAVVEREMGGLTWRRSAPHKSLIYSSLIVGGGEDIGRRRVFEVAVVGLGMIGSAAARHLSLMGSSEVVAIGPPEPSTPHWGEHHGPFASHYDQGRLTRISDPDPVWAKLAASSIARYPDLEHSTRVRFHFPVGCLRVEHSSSDGLRASFDIARRLGAMQSTLLQDPASLHHSFPFFSFQEGDAAVMEAGDAGYINPRSMVAAQLKAAELNGATILRESVKEIVPARDTVKIVMEKGKAVWARRVLVCAGSYSGFLLPQAPQRVLDLQTFARTVVLAEVEEEEEKRLGRMPTFIWRPRDNAVLDWVYGCPPIKYPDGRVMLKVGGTAWAAAELGGSEAKLDAWFRSRKGGCEEEGEALEKALFQLMPGLRVRSITTKPCVVSFTAHGRPYIDAVDGDRTAGTARVFVAAGGCGAAAKSSDEIGRLAALLVWNRRWGCSELEAKLFRAMFKAVA